MIHFALFVFAVYVLGRLALWAFSFVAEAFDQNFAWGCLCLLVIAFGAVILLAVAC